MVAASAGADVYAPGADTRAEADAHDTGANSAVDEAEGFLGGPRNPSVLTGYADHVASSVWSGEVFIVFNLS